MLEHIEAEDQVEGAVLLADRFDRSGLLDVGADREVHAGIRGLRGGV
jgi:hypothetical protein